MGRREVCYLLLDKTDPRLKADRMLQDLSCIALKHAQSSVQQRLTLKPNSRGENRAPIVFQYDKEGEYLACALLLREALPSPPAASEDSDSDSDSSIPLVDAGARQLLIFVSCQLKAGKKGIKVRGIQDFFCWSMFTTGN